MRSICNIDFKNNVAWGSSASAQSLNEILLSIYPTENMINNLRIEITDVKGKVITESVERERNGLINHTLSSLYYLTAGSFKLRLLSDEENSSYISYKTLENLTDGDDIICKYRFATQTFEVYKIVIDSGGEDYDDTPLWDAIDEIRAKYITVDEFNAEKATIYSLIAEKASISDLTAINADIENLKANKADIGELNAEIAKVNELIAKKANIDDLHAIEATIEQLNAHIANIDKAIIDVAHIDDLEAINARIDNIQAGNIDTDALEAHFARIDLANIKDGCITTAMIGEGVIESAQIADGSITDAKIVTLTANKLTAGRIDASDIEVVNLNCANLTVGTINGHQITNGAIDWDKLASQVGDTINNADENASQALEDALKAYQEAQKANSAAGTAQSTANGKNTVIYATSQPSTSGRKANDVWFDTDDSYKMYYFNGTAWVAAQFGTNAIKNASITTALIADAAINNAKIANLDAGKITSGYISSDRIQAGSIVIGKLDGNTQNTISTANSNASKALSDAAAASSKAGNAQSTAESALNKANDAQSTADSKAKVFTSTPTVPYKIGDLWVQGTSGVIMKCKVSRSSGSYTDADWEKADKYTDDTKANAVDQYITNWCYNNDKTYINGGKIYTGTVNAVQIAANAIIAGKIAANAVTTANLQSDCVNADKIAAKSINAEHINGAIITGDKIVASTITGDKIAARTIDATKIVANTITSEEIKSGTITGNEIAAGTIDATKIKVNSITATQIATNAITAEKILANAITSVKIATDAIKSRNYVAGSVGSFLNLADGTFTSKNLKWTSDGTLTATNGNFKGTITGSTINGGTITGATINGGNIFSNSTIHVNTNATIGQSLYLGLDSKSSDINLKNNMILEDSSGNFSIRNLIDSSKTYFSVSSNGNCGIKGFDNMDITAHNGYVQIYSRTGGLKLQTGTMTLYFENESIGIKSNNLRPAADCKEKIAVGTADYLYYRFYAKQGIYQPSDIRLKTNIREYDKRFEEMYMDLKPVTYEWKNERGKSHCGLIAQWTKNAMDKHGITETEFGAYEHDDGADTYGITYTELPSLNMYMVQKTIKRVDMQEEEIARLKKKVTELQSKLNAYVLGEMEIRA